MESRKALWNNFYARSFHFLLMHPHHCPQINTSKSSFWKKAKNLVLYGSESRVRKFFEYMNQIIPNI